MSRSQRAPRRHHPPLRLGVGLLLLVVTVAAACSNGGADRAGAVVTAEPVTGDLGAPPQLGPQRGRPPTGVEVDDLVVGDGPVVEEGAVVTVHLVGVGWSSGEPFETTWERGPRTIPLVDAVPGFHEGMIGAAVGGRRRIVVPPDAGYGTDPPPGVAAGETLVFVVDLLAVDGA